MKTIVEILASRENDWRELERLARELKKPRFGRRADPETIARFASLYRAVCSDLALSQSYSLPPSTTARLSEIVAFGYDALYSSGSPRGVSWRKIIFLDAPRWILTDAAFWISLVLFWGCFLTSAFLARYDSNFAADLVGKSSIDRVVEMYSNDFRYDFFSRLPMVSFYVFNNGTIGLKAFVFGILGAFPGAFILLANATRLGAVYGYMGGAQCPPGAAARFFEFTLAHGPFELTAIVLAASAGLRIGLGVIMTRGYSRVESLRRATIKAAPTIAIGFALFCAAACLEAFVSPSPLPIAVKRAFFALSIVALFVYFPVLGGIAILRQYRGLPASRAARSFWRFATVSESNREPITDSNSKTSSSASSAPNLLESSTR